MLYSHTIKLVRFYEGVDGLKTGYTKEAGFCMTTTAKKNGMRVIVTVMGEPDSKTRNSDVSSVLDYTFAQYGLETKLDTDSIVKEATVLKGKKDKVGIVPIQDVTSLYKKTDGSKELTYDITMKDVKAPVKKGDVVGTLTLKIDGVDSKQIDLTVKEDVEKANLFELYLRYMKEMLSFQ